MDIVSSALVVGGSLGGVMASYSLCKSNIKTILVEETDWIGGQLTSQAVPPDEHKFIETTGASKTYLDYRKRVRNYYRKHPFIIDELKNKEFFCPGGSTVSRLAHPPKLALSILEDMLEPYIESGLLVIIKEAKILRVIKQNDNIEKVFFKKNDEIIGIKADYFLDGTDTGELIYLSGEKYTVGAESVSETGEFHAPKLKNKKDMQPVTSVLAVEYNDKNDNPFIKPDEYEYFKKLIVPYDKYPVLSMYGPDSSTGKAKEFGFFNNEKDKNGKELFGLFTYRRIVCSSNFKDNYEPYDITLLNWPQNDYFMDNIFETDDDKFNRYMADQLSLSLLYYLQTEVKRENGKIGYRGLKARGDIVGTENGIAKYPYIRESRRLDTEFKVTENMISKKYNNVPAYFYDSVGVGLYHIDIHITTKTNTFFFEDAVPFEIPLRTFIAKTIKNLVPCCKNIGLTHLTNGCYRLHPVEWNIGESAGYAVAYSLYKKISIEEIVKDKNALKEFQELLIDNGIMLHWDKEINL